MSRLMVLAGTASLLLGAAGCAHNPRTSYNTSTGGSNTDPTSSMTSEGVGTPGDPSLHKHPDQATGTGSGNADHAEEPRSQTGKGFRTTNTDSPDWYRR